MRRGKAVNKRARAASPTPSVATSTTSTPAPDDRPPAKRGRVTTLEDMRLAFLERYDPNKWTAQEILGTYTCTHLL